MTSLGPETSLVRIHHAGHFGRPSTQEVHPRTFRLWIANGAAILSILAACLGPNTILLMSHPVYVSEMLLLVGATIVGYADMLSARKMRMNIVWIAAIALLGSGLVVAGGDFRQGIVVVVAVPAAAFLLANHVSPAGWSLGAVLGVLPILRATLQENVNPASWLLSPYNEGLHSLSIISSSGSRFLRIPATFPGPSVAGAAEILLSAVILLSTARVRRGALRTLARVAGLVFVVLSMLTLTRSSILAAVIASLVILISRMTPLRERATALAIGVSVIVLAFGPLYIGLSQDRSPISHRVAFVAEALSAWERSPLTGIGYGQLSQVVIDPIEGPLYHAHFFAAQYLVELGPLGLAGILLLFWTIGRSAWRHPESRAVFVGLLILASVDVGVLLYGRTAVLFWLAAACAASFNHLRWNAVSVPGIQDISEPP